MEYIVLNFVMIELAVLSSSFFKKLLTDELMQAMLTIVNLSVCIVGIQGAIQTDNAILLMMSGFFGALIGTKLDIDGAFQRFGVFLKRLFKADQDGFTKAFITVFLIQCVGSMAILGPMNIALTGDASLLMIKTVLDASTSVIFGALYGKGILISGFLTFVFQTIVFLLAGALSHFMTPEMIVEITAVGGLLIFALSLDMLKILPLKVANYLPALFIPSIYYGIRMLF